MFTVILIDAFSEMFQLHIVDLDPSSVTTGGWLEDTSLVEKYNISEEDYAKRTDEGISMCKYQREKRGVVKYVGRAESLGPGYWVGIQYDEPLGKHDGISCFCASKTSLRFLYWLVSILKETLYVKPEKGV
ncbi:hypothetical protein HID58_044498 [Brassica napus]|uniref:CAP-Gly domain-containing protein n=1 Tax=Brassica napus TaxID=3708 RepID=A0ABQ8BJK2_BRANA|nr:hypothetical protein HID58_044498 [Brassica napus]